MLSFYFICLQQYQDYDGNNYEDFSQDVKVQEDDVIGVLGYYGYRVFQRFYFIFGWCFLKVFSRGSVGFKLVGVGQQVDRSFFASWFIADFVLVDVFSFVGREVDVQYVDDYRSVVFFLWGYGVFVRIWRGQV